MPEPYYQDDLVTLYHADCLEESGWLEADVLVTDPPYGIGWVSSGVTSYELERGMERQRKSRQRTLIENDETTGMRDAVLNEWGARPAIVFGTWRVERPKNVQHRLIWWKRGQNPGPANVPFLLQDEEIYVLGSGFVPSSPPLRSVIATSEERGSTVARVGHPTPKPIGLMEILVGRCQQDWIIADPFAGSGATLIAARNLGRRAIGVELEEKYCELIAKRLSQQAFNFAEMTA